jgi:hypothetical protein
MSSNLTEVDRHIILTIGQLSLLDFLGEIGKYLQKEDKIRESLRTIPLEDFASLVHPTLSKRWVTEGLGDEALILQVQEMRVHSRLKKVIDDVATERHICNLCYKGEESERGGRNGGEEYTVCSNRECISHTFVR